MADWFKEDRGDLITTTKSKRILPKFRSAQRDTLSKILEGNTKIKSLKSIIPIAPTSNKKKLFDLKEDINNLSSAPKFNKAYKSLADYWQKIWTE